MLFTVVIFVSAIVGALVVSNVSLVTLIIGLIGFFFTFPYAVFVAPVLAVFYVLTGNRVKGESLIRQANDVAWRPWTWAGHLISFMWARLGDYLSEADSTESGQQPTSRSSGQPQSIRRSRSALTGKVVPSYMVQQPVISASNKTEKRDRDDANAMLVITAIFDGIVLIVSLAILK
jgi:hypothetical protein